MISIAERDFLKQNLDKIPFETNCSLKKFSKYQIIPLKGFTKFQ